MSEEQPKYYTLITGASSGIGRAIATECAKKGFNLFLVSLPDSKLDETIAEIKAHFAVDVKSLGIDLTQTASPQKVFDFSQENEIIINNLVNNAGVGFEGEFENSAPELVDKMLLLNIRSTTLLTLLFLPEMKKIERAHILNISSFASFVALPNKSVYAATKTYILFLTRALNRELKNTSVLLTSVHPSGVTSEHTKKNIRKLSALTRITTLTPEEVAQTAVRNMLNGKKFVVPGGATKFYYLLGSVLPQGLLLRIVGRIFSKTS
ncbi:MULTISPECIES: SDR family NAD(P)-dependent oxidoreductase [Maribellus]|uniref:SDR family NAD(P)-dependent oxidoreductase n=1 Tax=Maribellus comscasis TaxID=2681766 RepID=A0A6I6JRT2_9BACT|nr:MULTISPECIES: SDR family NAD(P)-dependent oxidoreductase [Maribellus]MCG6189639.1 SDR family NAD(P)-dependent oxidoreductase [Maribellus maritimus]QGY43780.1 SDR family NAD(P)-dependent oxidoreductase [Maribellus comscasis]